MDFRHEWKHLLSASDLPILRQRLGSVMKPDPHAIGGKYQIRSLYFDTPGDTALREKLDGVSVREKFRIRCYNNDLTLIHLEKKSKFGGLGRKESTDLTWRQVSDLLAGRLTWMKESDQPLVQELYSKMCTQGLAPKTLVDYTREPFVFEPGNVRVTLDYEIRTALQCIDFLDPYCLTIPVGDKPVILEVKWDAFLPDIIRDAVQLPGRQTSSFSKYAACRMYD